VVDLQRDVLDVGQAPEVAAAPDEVLGRGHLEDLAADIVVRALDPGDDVGERDAVGRELVRVEVDLVLLHEAADRGHLGDALHRLEGVPQVPVLQGAELGQAVLAGVVHQGVLIDPADAGRVRPDDGVDALGQGAPDGVQVLDHAGAGPVEVGPVLEDHVDEGPAEHRLPADELHLGRGDELGGDGIGDLVLDQVGGAPLPVGGDDHLGVAEVREGVERGPQERPVAAGDSHERQDADQERVPGARLDQPADERGRRRGRGRGGGGAHQDLRAPCTSDSASTRKLALLTTRSPAFSPPFTS
jgi:hypothetical protein